MKITLDESDIKQNTISKPPFKRINRRKDVELNRVNNPSKIKKITKIIFSVTGFLFAIFLSYGGYLVYKTYKAGREIGFRLNPSDVISKEIPTLKKDSTGTYTNALLVGIDTREAGDLLNTDTIILASYNHKTNNVVLLSIPRDFFVQIKPDLVWYNKINSVYSNYQKNGEEEGLLRLRDVITEMTGYEIQYHAMIDFKGFTELLDTLGGIEVNVENSFTDYQFPDEEGYKTVSFEEGLQVMDGTTALEYARSRHSLQNGEGSDFARARRQQNVISAVLNKIISSSLLDPQSLMNLFNVIQDNVKISEFTLNDINAGFTELNKFKENGEIFSFVLDPNIGGRKLVTDRNVSNNGTYAIGPVDGLGNYDDIKEFLDYVWEDPQLYEEDPIIRIYNTGLGYTQTRERYLELTDSLPYLKIYYMGTLYNDKEGTILYINAKEGYLNSLQLLKEHINPDTTEKPDYITTTLNAEDISILFGQEKSDLNDTQETE